MIVVQNKKIIDSLRRNDAQISAKGKIELQKTFNHLLDEIIVLSKKAAEQENRKRITETDIKLAIKMYGESKGLAFLDQLKYSTQEGFENFFERKKQELVKWKQ